MLSVLFTSHEGFAPKVRCLKHVTYFPKLGIAFNRIKKNSSSSSIGLLSYLESGHITHAMAAKGASPHIDELGPKGIIAFKRAHRVVVLRDPFSRVLSAFLDKFRSTDYRNRFGYFELNRKGFNKFLQFLSHGGLRSNQHWGLQTEQLALPISYYHLVVPFSEFPTLFVDALARWVPNIRDLAPAVLGADAGQPTPTRAGKRLADFYDADAIRLVQNLYAKDLELPVVWSEAEEALATLGST